MVGEDIQPIPSGNERTAPKTVINGVVFEGEISDIQPQRLEKLSTLVHDINFYLDTQVDSIMIHPTMKAGGSASGGVVTLARRIFDDPETNADAVAWHELSHKYYDELRGDLVDYLRTDRWKPYAEDFNPLYVEAMRESLANSASVEVSPISNMMLDWNSFRENSVIALFNPANYREGKHSDEHPHWHSGELYAYASEIMRYYPDEFMIRLGQLKSDRERQLAQGITQRVASSFIAKDKHPKDLDVIAQFA
ncbi:hypothetical protein A2Z22_04320 [Candidatus Woesebacteria bacterium RBG_16_34_12]|uniref:Uncharacterized protein n=1 Tax=Candidatus Woesebacteria bacterium RBG_16_34_12 TaxID=1802480 RepID=A0A1F7XBJ3_9BACT|nr:MAG: hypothetical protein A2Z22_04320 [Candidatus Woesebacteria bacterium RBG_16_34_12]